MPTDPADMRGVPDTWIIVCARQEAVEIGNPAVQPPASARTSLCSRFAVAV
jgi:hypothetical protein